MTQFVRIGFGQGSFWVVLISIMMLNTLYPISTPRELKQVKIVLVQKYCHLQFECKASAMKSKLSEYQCSFYQHLAFTKKDFDSPKSNSRKILLHFYDWEQLLSPFAVPVGYDLLIADLSDSKSQASRYNLPELLSMYTSSTLAWLSSSSHWSALLVVCLPQV